MDPILSVDNLGVVFRTDSGLVRAVDGISYDLFSGKTLAIVGESGSGKSVHALSILRLLPEPPAEIVSGQILFEGRDLLSMSRANMRMVRGNRIAMIFQEPMTSLNPVLTVGEQIAEAVMIHRKIGRSEALRKAAELLDKVGIPHASERIGDYPHQFSGGMRQRAMIAMALSCDPDVLIADEPTTALDVTIQAQILDLLKELQRDLNMAIVLITHNLGVVAEMADEVCVMYAGRQMEQAEVGELFKNPRHPYTRGLLNSVPSLYDRKDRLEAIPGQTPDLMAVIKGCPFEPRCALAMPRCRNERPARFSPAPRHYSFCWKEDENTVEKGHVAAS
ncbi:MAG: ABC transporter ATP-binding protein [Elusimicrobiota bacterium]